MVLLFFSINTTHNERIGFAVEMTLLFSILFFDVVGSASRGTVLDCRNIGLWADRMRSQAHVLCQQKEDGPNSFLPC